MTLAQTQNKAQEQEKQTPLETTANAQRAEAIEAIGRLGRDLTPNASPAVRTQTMGELKTLLTTQQFNFEYDTKYYAAVNKSTRPALFDPAIHDLLHERVNKGAALGISTGFVEELQRFKEFGEGANKQRPAQVEARQTALTKSKELSAAGTELLKSATTGEEVEAAIKKIQESVQALLPPKPKEEKQPVQPEAGAQSFNGLAFPKQGSMV